MTSITVVAKAAGVSIATVSRVINHLPQVAPDTAAAVHRAMEEVGYRPNRMSHRRARDAVPQSWPAGVRHGSVAILFPDTREEALRTALSGRLVHGVNTALSPVGMTIVSTPLTYDGGLPSMVASGAVDGLIVRTTVPVAHLVAAIPPMPIVWLLELTESYLPRGDQVLEDTAAIGRLAARQLLARGHRRLAILNHEPAHPSYQRRTRAFLAEAQAAGAQVDVLEPPSAISPEEIPTLVQRFRDLPDRPTGMLLPVSDAGLVIFHRALIDLGLRSGTDLEIVACANDLFLPEALGHGLFNINIHPEAIAQAAGDLLLWRLANLDAPRRRVLIEPSLDLTAAGDARKKPWAT